MRIQLDITVDSLEDAARALHDTAEWFRFDPDGRDVYVDGVIVGRYEIIDAERTGVLV